MARPKKKYIVTHSNSFTTYLDKALKEKGKTWENLITDLSFSTSAIRNWLSGHRYPSLDSIKKIADYLSISDPKLLIQRQWIVSKYRKKYFAAGKTPLSKNFTYFCKIATKEKCQGYSLPFRFN